MSVLFRVVSAMDFFGAQLSSKVEGYFDDVSIGLPDKRLSLSVSPIKESGK